MCVLLSNMIISRLLPLRPALRKQTKQQTRLCSVQSDAEAEKDKELDRIAKDASIYEPPTGCCQSGCANCVYIVWAEAVTKKMDNAGPEIAEKILKMVEDPSMRAFLEMELRIRGLKK